MQAVYGDRAGSPQPVARSRNGLQVCRATTETDIEVLDVA